MIYLVVNLNDIIDIHINFDQKKKKIAYTDLGRVFAHCWQQRVLKVAQCLYIININSLHIVGKRILPATKTLFLADLSLVFLCLWYKSMKTYLWVANWFFPITSSGSLKSLEMVSFEVRETKIKFGLLQLWQDPRWWQSFWKTLTAKSCVNLWISHNMLLPGMNLRKSRSLRS